MQGIDLLMESSATRLLTIAIYQASVKFTPNGFVDGRRYRVKTDLVRRQMIPQGVTPAYLQSNPAEGRTIGDVERI